MIDGFGQRRHDDGDGGGTARGGEGGDGGCPLVEGAVVATIDSVAECSFEAIKEDLKKVGETKKF